MPYSWKVTDAAVQLLPFLKVKLGPLFSGKALKKALDHNQCQVNGKVERFGTRWLGSGDSVAISIQKDEIKRKLAKPAIIYEDADFLVCNKPAGMTSESDSLLESLTSSPSSLILLHRLDKETSGVLLLTKKKALQDPIIELFRAKKVFKKYDALVDGVLQRSEGTVDNYLGKLTTYQGQSLWGPVSEAKGLHAVTKWRLKQKGKNASWVECFPLTGRTHQLRVHLSQLGHPILGDFQYGRQFQCPFKPARHLLHASALAFSHPITKEELKFNAPFPADWEEAVTQIFQK